MSNDRDLELVSAAADGRLGEKQRAELEKLLAESPDLRRFAADLNRLETLLSTLPEPSFPSSLHERIMNRLPRPTPPVVRRYEFRRPMLDSAWRYGLAAAVGGILAMAVYETMPPTQQSLDYDRLVGTVARDGRPAAAKLLDRYQVRAEGLIGSVHLRRSGDALLLDLQIESVEPVDISVDFHAAGFQPVALMQDGQPTGTIQLADRFLRTRSNGRHQVVLTLRGTAETDIEDARIEIEFSRNGTVLQRGSLSPGS